MSYADFLAACAEIDESGEGDFMGHRDEELVILAEERIGYRFPPTYRDFLLRYGCGDIRSKEFYGITHGDFDNSGIPDGIWYTFKEQQEGNLPHHLLIVYALGEGSLSCLDFSKQRSDGECPVVIWELTSQVGDLLEIEAEDFGQFLRLKVCDEE